MSRKTDALDRHIGTRLKMRRMLCGFTQEELANILGITFLQIQKYEKSTNRISAARLYEIAKTLKTSVEYFYDGFCDDELINVADIKDNISVSEYIKTLPRKKNFSERDIVTILLEMPIGAQKQQLLHNIENEIISIINN